MADPNGTPARALWYVAPGHGELRAETLAEPGPDQALLVTTYSAISRGTERLVCAGLHDPVHRARMRAPLQSGEFPFPVKYGYCAVARVERGPAEWLGRTAFVLHPHQDRFVADLDRLHPVPASVPPRRATLAAQMETALNAVWDAGGGPGDRIVVIGAGVVGLMVAALAAALPGAEVVIADVDPARRDVAEQLGIGFAMPEHVPREADIVFHASATAEGLAAALACAGQEAVVVELSWYGDATTAIGLGGAFHNRRLRLISSQVGEVAASRRPRWTRRRRLAKALDLLADPRFDMLITDEVAFDDLPAAVPRIFAAGAGALATVVSYS